MPLISLYRRTTGSWDCINKFNWFLKEFSDSSQDLHAEDSRFSPWHLQIELQRTCLKVWELFLVSVKNTELDHCLLNRLSTISGIWVNVWWYLSDPWIPTAQQWDQEHYITGKKLHNQSSKTWSRTPEKSSYLSRVSYWHLSYHIWLPRSNMMIFPVTFIGTFSR